MDDSSRVTLVAIVAVSLVAVAACDDDATAGSPGGAAGAVASGGASTMGGLANGGASTTGGLANSGGTGGSAVTPPDLNYDHHRQLPLDCDPAAAAQASAPSFVSTHQSVGVAPAERASGAPFEVFWRVCNTGSRGSGGTYRFVVHRIQELQVAPFFEREPVALDDAGATFIELTLPALEPCGCFDQAVGVNRALGARVQAQAPSGSVLPSITLGPEAEAAYELGPEGWPSTALAPARVQVSS